MISHHQFGEDIQLLQAKIQDISNSRTRYGIQSSGVDVGREKSSYADKTVQQWRRVPLHTHDSGVVGMEDTQEDILKQLFNAVVEQRAVISIVGMGGLGKTTLVKV